MLTEADALYGAAYQVLFERLDPDRCINHEIYEQLRSRATTIDSWISEQSVEVGAAYRRAMAEIRLRASQVLENCERGRQQQEARRSIPVPPEV